MKQTLLYLVVVLMMTSCASLQPLTDQMIAENKWTDADLQRIQFYLSAPITIQRKLTAESSEIVSGKIRVVNGERIEEVVIPKGTPGVFTFNPVDNRLGISFEDGDDRYLMFGPNPNRGDKYYLLASDWNNGVGKVQYEGKTWYTTKDSGWAHLLVDLKKIVKQERQQRTAKGRTIE